MRKILVFLSLCIASVFLSSCMSQPVYDPNNFETYDYLEVEIDNLKTIADYKAESIVSWTWDVTEESSDLKRIFVLSRSYMDFICYVGEFIYENKDKIGDASNITKISVSHNEDVIYFVYDDPLLLKTSAISIGKTNSFSSSTEMETMDYYLQEFSGINLVDIFLPYIIMDDDSEWGTFFTILFSIDNLNSENNYAYLDISEEGIITTGGSDSTITMQGDIGIYVDDNHIVNIGEEYNNILEAVMFNQNT